MAVAGGVTKGRALALIAAAGAIALGAWWLARDDEQRLAPRAERDDTRETVESGSAAGDAFDVARRADTEAVATDGAAGSVAESPDLGTGAIELRVVDALDGSPLANFAFLAWSERPHARVFARGVTDANGAATIERLPEGVVIVETARRPPQANALGATRLAAGQRSALELRVGRGGHVRGRVVDDLGRPLAGVRVGLDPSQPIVDERAPRRRFDFLMLTGPDGRYEIGALRSRPGGIDLSADGAMASQSQREVVVLFRWGQKTERLKALLRDDETVEQRDVLFERARTFAGRVVEESSSAPVAGALVTAHRDRCARLRGRAFDRPWAPPRQAVVNLTDEESPLDFTLAPWEPGFALSDEEAITAADGTFEVVSTISDGGVLLVVAPDWRRRTIDRPQVVAGGRVDGIEVRLAPETQLFLDVTEPGGGPLTSRLGLPPRLSLRTFVTTREGVEVAGQLFETGASTFGAAFSVAPQAIEQLSLRSDDHRPLDHPIAPPTGRPTLAFTLERKESHAIRLRVKFASEEDVERLGRHWILVDAVASPIAARGEPGNDGMASAIFDRKTIEPRLSTEVVLSVPVRRTWYVVARGPFGNGSSDSSDVDLGAFEPDGELHEVVLPPVSEAWLAARKLLAQPKQPEVDGGRPAKPRSGIVGAIVVDAATKERLADFSIDFHFAETRDGEEHEWLNRGRRRSALGIEWDTVSVPAGDYTLRVSAKGYRPSLPRPITVIADAPVDAGKFELEPAPRWRVRLLETDGTAAPIGWRLVHDVGHGVEEHAAIAVDADGSVTLFDELTPVVRLRAFAPSAAPYGNGVPPIDFELAAWPPETTAELRLPPRVPVAIEIDLAAVEADLLELPWTVSAIADGETRGATQARYSGGELARTRRLRRFDFDLPPGRWRIRSRAALYVADDTVVEIGADGSLEGNATQRVTARPR